MKHTMQYSVGDEVAHVPSNEADEFNAVAKEQNVTPEPIFTYRVSNKQGDVQQLDVPKAEYEEFAKTAGDNGYKIEPLRMMTMDDGTERYFSARELRAFMRSPEYLNSTDGAEAKARDEAVRQRLAEEEANAPGFWSELGRRMFTVGGARDNAEDSDWAKPYAYANDLCNALVGGLLKGSAKIEQAFGHLVGSDAIVRDAQAGQAAVDEYLPTDALDTKKPGAANKVLDVGKNVASVTGEFAPSLIPGVGQAYAASLVGGGATIRYMQVYDDAIAHGVDPDKAVGLASLGATVDAGQNMLLMGKFKGVWKGEQANLAQAAKEGLVRRLTKDTLKTGAIMSGGGMAGDVIDQAAEDKYWLDVERTAKVGFDQFIEGGLFHLVNTGVHNATRIKWGDDAKGIPAGAARDMMEAPEGRALIFSNSPDAARAIFKARRNGENVSRKMIEDLGLSGDVARTAADRNALGDRLMADYDAFKERVRTKMDDVQAAALTDEIASRSEEGVNNPAFEKVWFKAVEQIKDATELDDPARRKEIVDEAVKTTETPEERRQREQAVEDAIKARQAEDAAAQKTAEEGKTTVLPPETAPKATVEAPKTSDEAKSVEIQAATKPEEAGTTKETSGAPSAPTPVPARPAEATPAEAPKNEVRPENQRIDIGDPAGVSKAVNESMIPAVKNLKPGGNGIGFSVGDRQITVHLDKNGGTYCIEVIHPGGEKVVGEAFVSTTSIEYGLERAVKQAAKSINEVKFDHVIIGIENRIGELNNELMGAKNGKGERSVEQINDELDICRQFLSDAKSNRDRYLNGKGIKEMPWDRWVRWMSGDETAKPEAKKPVEAPKPAAEPPKAEAPKPAEKTNPGDIPVGERTFEPFDKKVDDLPIGAVVEDVDGKRYTHDVHGGWVDESGKTHLSDVAFKDGYAVVNKGGDVPKTDVGVHKTATDVPKAEKTVPKTTTTEAGTKPKHLTFAVTADGETPTPVTEAASAVRNAQSMLYRVRFSPAGKKRVEDATNKFNSTVEAFKKTISDPSVSLEELKAEADRFDEQEQKYTPKDISYSQHHNWAIGNAIRAEIARREGTEAPPERDAFHPQGVKPEDPWMESVRKDEDALAMRKRYKEAKTDDERKAIKAEFDKLVEKHKAEWEGQNGKIEEPTAKDVAEKPTLVAEKPVEKPSATEDVQKNGTSSRTLSDVARELEASKGLANPEERDKKVAKLQDEIDAMRTPGKDFEPFAGKPNAAKAAKCVADFLYKQTEKEKKDPKRSGDKLAKVFHDKESGVAVATDGRVMIATKHGFDPNGEADPTYPNWRMVVPKEENTPLSTKVNPTALAKTCKEVLRLARATGLKTDSEYSVPKIALKFGDFVNHFSAEYMLKVAKAMEANGITEIRTADKPGHPGVAKNGDTTIVFMPYRGANGDNTRTGRGDGGFVVNGYNGRIIAAPERTDGNMPEMLRTSREAYDKSRAESVGRAKKQSFYTIIRDAQKKGMGDPAEIYDTLVKSKDAAPFAKLNDENKAIFTDWVKTSDAEALASKVADYLDRSQPWFKDGPKEIAKFEKRIAAEDEIEGLIMRGQEARDFLGIKPEKAKPAEKVSDYDVEQEVKRVVGLIGKAENAAQLKEYADSFKFKDLDMVDGIKIDHDRISEALNKRSEELFGKGEAEAPSADNIASEIGGLIGNHLKAQTTAKNNAAGRKFKAEAKDALAKRLSELSDDDYASVKKNLKAIMGENGLDPAKAGYVQAIFNAETAKRNAEKAAESVKRQDESRIPADTMPPDRADAELIRKEDATISEPKKEIRPVITRQNSGRSTESPSTGESVPQADGGVKAAPGKFTDSVYEAYKSGRMIHEGASAFAKDAIAEAKARVGEEIEKFTKNGDTVRVRELNGDMDALKEIESELADTFDNTMSKSDIHVALRKLLENVNAISPIEGFEDISDFQPRRGDKRTGVRAVDEFNDTWDDEGERIKDSKRFFDTKDEYDEEVASEARDVLDREISIGKDVYDQLSAGDKRYFDKLVGELDNAKREVVEEIFEGRSVDMGRTREFLDAFNAVEQFGESARKMSELMRDNEGRPVLYTEKSHATEMAADGVRRAVKAFASRDPAEATAATEMINLAIENGGKFPTKKQIAEMAKDMPEEMRETFTRNADALRKYADGLKDKPSIADEATKLAEDVDAAIDAEEKGGGERPDAAPRGRGTGAISQDEPKPQGTTTTGKTSGIVTPQSFLKEARKLFPDVAMRGKGTARMAKWAAGHFEATTRTIRSRDMSAIRTITHELGHDLEYLTRYDLPRNPAAKRDLSDLGHALYPSGPGMPKPNSYIGEGFAEYVRGYICNAPDLAQVAPDMDAWFRGDFKAKHPEIVSKIDRLRDMVQTMKEQSAADTVRGFRHPATTVVERAWKKVTDFGASENWNDAASTILKGMKKSGIDKLYHWQDEFKELEAAVKAGDTVRAQQLAASVSDKVANHPYLFPTITRGTASQRVMDMARHGTTNLLGNQRTGESLKEIFADFSHKEQEAWKDYAIARHGIENYYAKGLEFGMPKDVLEDVVRQYDSPKFQQALQRVTDYSHRILHLGVDAGLISQEAYDKIVAEHPIYVRITRRKADDGAGTKQGGAAINKRTGGFENILDPIDAMLMDQEKYLRACFQAKSLQLIVGAANRAKAANLQSIRNNGGPNTSTVNPRSQSHIAVSAYWPIEVPNAQEKVTFGAGKLKQGLSDAAADYAARTGEDPIPLEEFINDLATYTDPQGRVTQLSVFRDKPSQGKHNLVSVYVDGKLHTYELPDMKWANMLTDVYDKSDFNWAERAFGLATAGIRLGATTINPGFAIRNGIRDSLHSAVMSETGAIPMLGTLNGMLNQLTGKEAAQMFRSMGGHMSDLVGVTKEQKWHHGGQVALAQNPLQSLQAYGAIDWALMKPVIKATSDILSVPELGPRVREFNGVLQKCRAAGLTEDVAAMLAMSHAKDISIDFQRAGRYMKHINHFIPFSNAMWRGTEQTIRNFGILPALPHQFEDNSIARGMKTTAKGLAYITSWMATLAMLEMAGDDKDRRRAFERDTVEKWEYAHVGDWRIPLPFELGYVFGAIPKAAIYEMYGDEGAMKECLGAFNQAMPSKYASPDTAIGSISLLTPWIGLLKNEDYRGRAIVPEHIMQNRVKEDWYTQYTTELSKRIGKTVGASPAQLEYLLDSYTGGLYRRTALAVENIGDTSRLQEGRGFSMLDTLRARPQANRLVSDFYKFGEEAKQKLGSGILSLEDYGKFASMNGVKEELTDRFGEMRAIRADKSIPLAEQDKRVQVIAEDINETIRNFNARDDYRQRGIAYAASHLTGSTLESLDEGTRQQYTALLKDVPTNEIVQALIKFGNETVMVKQKGVKVPHQRWSNKNVNTRVGRLLMLMQGR